MKIRPILSLATCVVLSLLTGCNNPAAETTAAEPAKIPVVLDFDIGGDVDDTWALAYLLRCPELDLKLVICSTGDVSYRARIAGKFLEVAGRTDVPLGLGRTDGPTAYNQLPWVEDYPLEAYPGTVHQDGVDTFIKMVHASPVPITLIALGEASSVAEALRRDPSIAPKLHFVGMYGSVDVGYNGKAPPSAESNVKNDVPAFRAALAGEWSSAEITPLDSCGMIVLRDERYDVLQASEDPVLRALFENYRIWSGLVTWTKASEYIDERSSTLFDIVAVYMAFDDRLLNFETIPLSVTDAGLTVRDAEAGHSVSVAMSWKDLDAFYDHITERLLGTPATGSLQ